MRLNPRPTVWLSLLALASAAGCQRARVTDPLTRIDGGNDPAAQMDFLHTLADRPMTSNDEAFHGLLLFLDGDDPNTAYAGRVETLRKRHMLPGSFNEPGDRAVERGTLAVALVRALKIPGGLTMRVIGPTPRYATRELQFLNIYPPSSPNQTFAGGEFLSVLTKAEQYQATGATPTRATPAPRINEKAPATQPTGPVL